MSLNTTNEYGFPYEPYPIQHQLMTALYKAMDDKKVAILESPTGTGKSLSTICAALTWLENFNRCRAEEIEHKMQSLAQQIKDCNEDDDWMAAHSRKLEAQKEISTTEEHKQYQQRITDRLEKAKQNVKSSKSNFCMPTNKRKTLNADAIDDNTDNIENFEKLDDVDDSIDLDLIPNVTESNANKVEEEEDDEALKPVEPLCCTKIIYASRTHSQLEQFAAELQKTNFRPRVLIVGSRQLLCVNESVRSLRNAALINDRCNELLNSKTTKCSLTNKRLKNADGSSLTKSSKNSVCGCEFSKAVAIEDLADEILVRQSIPTQKDESGSFSWLLEEGKCLQACPYFASRNALALCELVLVPYNILLHKATREAWNLNLKNNVVIVDEAHNLLQTLSAIHSCELDEQRLSSICALLSHYIEKFRNRLSPRNFLHVRQLYTMATCLLNLLKSLTTMEQKNEQSEKVFTIPRFFAQLNCSDIDLFKLLGYLEESNLCRKLRDFGLRYPNSASNKEESHTLKESSSVVNSKPKISKFAMFLQKTKENVPQYNANKTNTLLVPKEENSMEAREKGQLNSENKSASSTPLYQLKEFLEALTTRADDARILVQSSSTCAKYRFLLLNPADKLKDIVEEVRSFILIGGTMKPIDQLLDAFHRVCGLPETRIVQFSCGHVINDSQLIALSIGRGPTQMELNFSFAQRNSQSSMLEIARCFINLLRHIPNGVVTFFPSYSFLFEFVKAMKNSGDFEKIQSIKPLFIESRGGSEKNVWPTFCKEAKASSKGALLFAVVGGSLSEGINFSDELGRCVIMIGLPYANKNSIELCERMKYIDEKVGANAGSRFYESLCIHSLNQAIGRAIRHRNDYAAIILLDSRFLRENISSQLPHWIKQRLTPCKTFSESLTKLIGFFRDKKLE